LKGLTGPIGIITVVGKYRTGKSLFVNRVLINNSNGFKVGPSVNPCTKGLWLWRESLKAENPEQPDM
jgi:septin family protein